MIVAVSLAAGLLLGIAFFFALRQDVFRLAMAITLLVPAVNLFVFLSGGLVIAAPPLMDGQAAQLARRVADPLPHALVLTAIVIGFGMQMFAYALLKRVGKQLGSGDLDSEEGRRE